MLLVSQGVPMILMGDEVGQHAARQQQRLLPRQRAELAGLERWTETNADLFRFFQQLIAFRHAHPVLRNRVASQQPATTSAAATRTSPGTAPRPGSADWSGCQPDAGLHALRQARRAAAPIRTTTSTWR